MEFIIRDMWLRALKWLHLNLTNSYSFRLHRANAEQSELTATAVRNSALSSCWLCLVCSHHRRWDGRASSTLVESLGSFGRSCTSSTDQVRQLTVLEESRPRKSISLSRLWILVIMDQGYISLRYLAYGSVDFRYLFYFFQWGDDWISLNNEPYLKFQ